MQWDANNVRKVTKQDDTHGSRLIAVAAAVVAAETWPSSTKHAARMAWRQALSRAPSRAPLARSSQDTHVWKSPSSNAWRENFLRLTNSSTRECVLSGPEREGDVKSARAAHTPDNHGQRVPVRRGFRPGGVNLDAGLECATQAHHDQAARRVSMGGRITLGSSPQAPVCDEASHTSDSSFSRGPSTDGDTASALWTT